MESRFSIFRAGFIHPLENVGVFIVVKIEWVTGDIFCEKNNMKL